MLDQHTGVVDRLGQTLLENLKGHNKRGDGSEKIASLHLSMFGCRVGKLSWKHCLDPTSWKSMKSCRKSNRSTSQRQVFAVCQLLVSQMHRPSCTHHTTLPQSLKKTLVAGSKICSHAIVRHTEKDCNTLGDKTVCVCCLSSHWSSTLHYDICCLYHGIASAEHVTRLQRGLLRGGSP